MEEKFYFKPSSFEQKKTEIKNINQKRNKILRKKILRLLIFFITIIIVVILIIFFLRGEKTVSGRFPDNLRNESLKCSKNDIIYPYTNSVNPESTKMDITMVFYGDEELISSSLTYTMNFKTKLAAGQAESLTHAQFAKILASSGLQFGEFNNKFTILDERLVLSLYYQEGTLTSQTKDFFLVNEIGEEKRLPKTLSEYQKNYESQAFSCETTLNKSNN